MNVELTVKPYHGNADLFLSTEEETIWSMNLDYDRYDAKSNNLLAEIKNDLLEEFARYPEYIIDDENVDDIVSTLVSYIER